MTPPFLLVPDLATLFQNAQENHGLAVPTPSVPEDFADKEVTGKRTLGLGLVHLSFLFRPRYLAHLPRPLGYWLQRVRVEEARVG